MPQTIVGSSLLRTLVWLHDRGPRATPPPAASDPTPLDPTQWLAWCLAGVRMFAAGSPSLSLARSEATRVAMVLAMLQTGGNITRAAALLQTSRKSLRDRLKRAELYPWPLGAAGLLSETVERS